MAVQISGNDITVPRDGSFTRNVTIGGTLTYEDVTNIDSVGLVTARNGIEIGARPGVAASISVDGNMIVSGISTFNSRVLLGTTIEGYSSADDLTVATTGHTGITIRSGNTSLGTLAFSDGTSGAAEYDGYIQYSQNDRYMDFATGGGNISLRIASDGKVGVNKTAPNFHLDVAGNIGLTEGQVITWHDGSGTKAGDMYIDSSDNFIIRNTSSVSERLRIDSSGRLGIGTASGTRGLNVEGTGTASRLFVNDSTNHKAVEFGADSTGSFQSTFGDNPHLIYTNGTERARFTSDGLKFPNTKGIDFSASAGSNATSSLFDDYEEGTWTPSFSAGETLSIYSARYTKIGRLVTANCYIYNFSDLSGNTNSFNIEGLPYSASGGNYHGGGMIGYAYVMNYGYPLLPLVSQNTNIGYFHRQDGTGSAWRYVDMHNVGNGSGGQLIVTFVYETST